MANIQWFPGHMTKAKRLMEANLKLCDMVIELRDARIPLSSKNPMIDRMIQKKPRLIILTKKDKADDSETQKWIKFLRNETTEVIAVDSTTENVVPKIVAASKKVCKPTLDRMVSKGINPRALRSMVCGIPNVGKSTLINKLAKKKVAKTSDKPGVTRSLQWVKLNKELELLDTPGVLWPKFESEEVGYNLAIVGSINDNILNLDDIVIYALRKLMKDYPKRLENRYSVILKDDVFEVLDQIAIKKGWLLKGNKIDYDRAMKVILNEIRDDKLGNITWETVDENNI
jgi:ribosome biogenesis GTPase A